MILDPIFSPFRSFPEKFILGGDEFETYLEAEGAEGAKGAEEVDQGEVSTIILGMLESSGFRT